MTKNKLHIIFIIIMSLFSFSCKKNKPEQAIYAFGTEEFKEKSNELKYNRQDAVNIYCKYAFEHLQKDSISFYTFIIYGNDYVFTTIPYNLKTGTCYLNGYWVDGETGELKKEESGKYVKVFIEKYGSSIHIKKDEFKKNENSAFAKEE